MATRKVPSQAASGKDTFSDSLVGFQITDGSSQLTNTNFEIDRNIPEKDSKKFRTNPFSDFFTLDELGKENDVPTTQEVSTKNEKIKFKDSKNDAGRSLFGSLNSRIGVSIKNIISKFPAGFLIDKTGIRSVSLNTANDIVFDSLYNTTKFNFEVSKTYNPFDVSIVRPNSNTLPETNNNVRNFFSSYTKYVVEINKVTYPIIGYNTSVLTPNIVTLTVNGSPFGTLTSYTENILIRPINGVTEEFFNGLDEIESQLLNRETNPIYTANFIVPKDSFDLSSTDLVTIQHSWPVDRDGWNIKINGFGFDNYITDLSNTATEIDVYKSNLIVRFLSSPQLFEFDTEDKKAESIFQLYGQSFDRVKKYIDNIAYMRNVSYDGVRNLPDVLLKNLSETLGLSTINLFDEKNFEDLLYTRHDTVYAGESINKNLFEAEYEFYRRLLVNLSFIYKSKGTRSSIEFFLKFLGAPEPLISINEYVYKVTDLPNSKNLEDDIYDVLIGGKQYITAIFDSTTFEYTKIITTGTTTFSRSGYPVDETTGLPRKAFSLSNDIFFQKGAGWYDVTLYHRASDIIDEENSILTGRTKVIKTKMKPFVYGEDYFDVFRTLPGLDMGYELESKIDNKKAHLYDSNSSLVLNRKNVDIFLIPTNAIDYDIWRKSNELSISFGNLTPQTGITFAEFVEKTIHKLVRNSNVTRYKKNYISLEDVYYSYLSTSGFTKYNFIDVNEFINKITPYWTQVIEQFIPATTLWRGGNLISNGMFGRSKYQYKLSCQPKEYVDVLYPNFDLVIKDDLVKIIGDEDNFRGLIEIDEVVFTPIIEIDGVEYSNPISTIIVSGDTTTSNSAKLFDSYSLSGCSGTTIAKTNLTLICGDQYVNPDVSKIKELWLSSLTDLIDNVINKSITGYTAGYENYEPYQQQVSGETLTWKYIPQLTYEFFTDENGVEHIKFISVKTNNGCSINNHIRYRYDVEYRPINPKCDGIVDVYTNGEIFSGTSESCNFVDNVYINVSDLNNVQNNEWPVYVFGDCNLPINSDIVFNSGRTLTYDGNCNLIIDNVKEHDDIKLNIVDASNCETVLKVTGLQLKCEPHPITTTGFTIQPIIELRNSYLHGLKWDSYVYHNISGVTIDNTTTKDDIDSYITSGNIVLKQTYELNVNDEIIIGKYKNCSELNNNDFANADINGYSFIFNYDSVKINDIECVSSVKMVTVSGITKDNQITTFDVLPTTELKVYTNKKVTKSNTQTVEILVYSGDTNNVISSQENTFVCGTDSVVSTSYFLDNRFSEDLQIRTSEIETPCCVHNSTQLNNNGDYLISIFGEPIEVIGTTINQCTPNLYFNLTLSGLTNNDYVITFNGNNEYQVLLQHEHDIHDVNMGFDLQQYCLSGFTDTPPTIESLLRPDFGVECTNTSETIYLSTEIDELIISEDDNNLTI